MKNLFMLFLVTIVMAQTTSLKSVVPAGKYIGSMYDYLWDRTKNDSVVYDSIAKNQFNVITVQVFMSSAEASRGVFNYTVPDSDVSFGKRNNMKIRVHYLVWGTPAEVPTWVSAGNFNRDTLLKIIKIYIDTTVNHFKGKVDYYSVVNEVFEAGSNGQLEYNLFDSVIGRDYIDSSFVWAHKADSTALLFDNETHMEWSYQASDSMYKLDSGLKLRGIPINGVGFQYHIKFKESGNAIDFNQVQSNFTRFSNLGFTIHITELDVALDTPVTSNRVIVQGQIYNAVAKMFLINDSCKVLTMWGFNDSTSWINTYQPGYAGACIYDKHFSIKPSYTALYNGLQGKPYIIPHILPYNFP